MRSTLSGPEIARVAGFGHRLVHGEWLLELGCFGCLLDGVRMLGSDMLLGRCLLQCVVARCCTCVVALLEL